MYAELDDAVGKHILHVEPEVELRRVRKGEILVIEVNANARRVDHTAVGDPRDHIIRIALPGDVEPLGVASVARVAHLDIRTLPPAIIRSRPGPNRWIRLRIHAVTDPDVGFDFGHESEFTYAWKSDGNVGSL